MRLDGKKSKNFIDNTHLNYTKQQQLMDQTLAGTNYHWEQNNVGPAKITPEEKKLMQQNGWSVEDILILRSLRTATD